MNEEKDNYRKVRNVIRDRHKIDWRSWGLSDYGSLILEVSLGFGVFLFLTSLAGYYLEIPIIRDLAFVGSAWSFAMVFGAATGSILVGFYEAYSGRWNEYDTELLETQKACPSCGDTLLKEKGTNVYRCDSCRFEGLETPTYRLRRWIRGRMP